MMDIHEITILARPDWRGITVNVADVSVATGQDLMWRSQFSKPYRVHSTVNLTTVKLYCKIIKAVRRASIEEP